MMATSAQTISQIVVSSQDINYKDIEKTPFDLMLAGDISIANPKISSSGVVQVIAMLEYTIKAIEEEKSSIIIDDSGMMRIKPPEDEMTTTLVDDTGMIETKPPEDEMTTTLVDDSGMFDPEVKTAWDDGLIMDYKVDDSGMLPHEFHEKHDFAAILADVTTADFSFGTLDNTQGLEVFSTHLEPFVI